MVLPNSTVGVVLAGGRSSRMGRDKAMLSWAGTSLLDHMRRLLLEAGVDSVVVSGDRPGYDSLPDAQPDRGPGVAVAGVLAALPPDGWAVIVPVDMPLLTVDLVRRLITEPRRPGYFVGHPLPAMLPTRDPAGSLLVGDSIRALHRQAGSEAQPVAPEDESAFLNVNTPDDWLRAQEQVAP